MLFNEIIDQQYIKTYLKTSVEKARIAHAQLFIGKQGVGTLPMAIAYAQYLLCHSSNNIDICNIKCNKLQHPDLHFSFPVAINNTIKKNPISDFFLDQWREFIIKNPYGSLFNWLKHIGVENKQGLIGVDEAESIIKKLHLKSYEGGFKIMIIWMAEKMNMAAANKLLKLIEEPPKKTVFLLVTENEQQIIDTIKSRCQVLNFPLISQQSIALALVKKEKITMDEAKKIADQSEGNYNKAIDLLNDNSNELLFEKWFILWVRTAFKAKGNPTVIKHLIEWSKTIAKTGRETQKQFLQYCLRFFRQALLLNYKAKELVFLKIQTDTFDLAKFASFVHSGNILSIEEQLNKALYHIEKNGNAKIILLDVSIKLTRLLHIKEMKV